MVLALVAAACRFGADAAVAAGDTIKVGVTVERTGPQPTLGKALEGIEAAAEYLNARGGVGGKPVELVVRDNAADPNEAVANIREFADNGIGVVVGPVWGPDCHATSAFVARADMVAFCIAGDTLPERDDHMFGVGTDYTATTDANFDLMGDLGGSVGMFAPETRSGDDKARLAEQEANEGDIQIEIERHDSESTSLEPQLQRLLASRVDILHLTSCAPVTVTAVSEAIDLGFEGEILIENCHVSAETAQAVKEFANDQVIVLAPQFMLGGSPAGDPRAGAIELYWKEVGEPDIVVAVGWDAMLMAAQAIEEAGSSDAGPVLETLERGFTYTGVWAWNAFEGDEHRGAQRDGALIPAYITSRGTFERL
jgi:branched-chain amino acid transport system substrate-binding protein